MSLRVKSRSRRIARSVPDGMSLLECRGIVVNRLLLGRYQISCEPAACRTNSHSSFLSFLVRTRYVTQISGGQDGLVTDCGLDVEATRPPWTASPKSTPGQREGPAGLLSQWNLPVCSDQATMDRDPDIDRHPIAECSGAAQSSLSGIHEWIWIRYGGSCRDSNRAAGIGQLLDLRK